ncbi:MAG: redox-sensing transcriptional repressor Rex [Actinomycetota bacterium]|nr:redox-sensing transcriptional repressor Rex [Actinomycetota bacterium]
MTTVTRLPLYLRSLQRLAVAHQATVSSARLAELSGLKAATVRKDLSYLGAWGTRGVGYDVDHLVSMTRHQLRPHPETPILIVGAGNLGRALSTYRGFSADGFQVLGLFDVARCEVGKSVGGLVVRHVSEIGGAVDGTVGAIGVIATPPSAAQDAADRLVAAGVGAILNFAPVCLAVLKEVRLRNVDVSVELQILAYRRTSGDS